MKLKFFLFCGILAPLLYVTTDILAAMVWEGYSYTAQTISETFAIGAPTRPLVLLGKRSLRVAGGLLVGICFVDLIAPFVAPMHLRGAERRLRRYDAYSFGQCGCCFYSTDYWVRSIRIQQPVSQLLHRNYSGSRCVRYLGRYGRSPACGKPADAMGRVTERISVFSYILWVVAFASGLPRVGK
jgi:hypothetical protein